MSFLCWLLPRTFSGAKVMEESRWHRRLCLRVFHLPPLKLRAATANLLHQKKVRERWDDTSGRRAMTYRGMSERDRSWSRACVQSTWSSLGLQTLEVCDDQIVGRIQVQCATVEKLRLAIPYKV